MIDVRAIRTAPAPRRPNDAALARGRWILQARLPPQGPTEPPGERWVHRRTRMQIVSHVHTTERGWEWCISISHTGVRPSSEAARAAATIFGMGEAEEDNHVSGRARHYWLAVDPAKRAICDCKDEEQVVEGDYVWSRPRAHAGDASGEVAAEGPSDG